MGTKSETKSEKEIELCAGSLKKITIRNFRCIGAKGIDIDLDRIVVLVGPNSVGKSTILRAYQYATDGKDISSDDFPHGVFDEQCQPTIELQTWLGEGKPPSVEWQIRDDNANERLYVKEQWVWGENCKATRKGWHAHEKRWATEVPWGAPNIAKANRPKLHRVEAFASPQAQASQVAKLLLECMKEKALDENKESVFEKVKRALQEAHVGLISETKERVKEIENKLTSLISKVFKSYKVEFSVSPNENPEKIMESLLTNPVIRIGSDSSYLVNVQDQGSGVQRTLLWAALKLLAEEEKSITKKPKKNAKVETYSSNENNKNNQGAKRCNVLLIDEPEICLHPSAVREACKTLYDLAECNPNWQVMITTHSPVFIDVSRDNTTIISVQRKEDGGISSTTIFRPDKVNLSEDDKNNLKLLNQWDPYIAGCFFGGDIILVEGDTEYSVFKCIINENVELFSNLHIIRARGKAILVSLIKILNHFDRPYTILHDSDMPTISTKNGSQNKNSMWTENEKIKESSEKSNHKNRVIASIKDFEHALFGKGNIKYNKPYLAWELINKNNEYKKKVFNLLLALHQGKPLPPGFLEWDTLEDLQNCVEEPYVCDS